MFCALCHFNSQCSEGVDLQLNNYDLTWICHKGRQT